MKGYEDALPMDPLRWAPEDLRVVQSERLRQTLAACVDRHPYYSRLWLSKGVNVEDIRTPGDLVHLPLTTKGEFLAAPDSFRLGPDNASAAGDVLWDVMYTTGSTTGQPSAVYASSRDHLAHLAAARREGTFIGLTSADTIANLLPLTAYPMGAYARSASDAASVGAAMIWCHTGRSEGHEGVHRSLDQAIDLVLAHHATVLWGIASFVRRFLLRVVERGIALPSVRMSLVTGEAVTEPLRAELSRLMVEGGTAEGLVVNRYGATELGTSLYECAPGSGLHLLTPESVYFEIVDTETSRPVPDGEIGSLAFTHLDRTGTVLVRYLMGDITAISHEPCGHCGRTTPRLTASPRRAAGLVKVKGTLINLNSLHENLSDLEHLEEVQIVVTRAEPADPFSPDALQIRVAASPEAQPALRVRVVELTTGLALVRPEVVFVTPGELFDPLTSPKAQHIVDQRRSGG